MIGSGPGGYAAAVLAAKKGLDVQVVEEGEIGGVCTNHGCIPSKALLSVAEKIEDIEGARRDGIDAAINDIDFRRVMGKKDRAVKISRKAINSLFDEHDIDIVKGSAEVRGQGEVVVKKPSKKEVDLSSKNIVIATGSEPSGLPEIEIDGEDIISSREALALDEIPDTMAIIGGGYIGLEMAYVYSSLGTKVTVIEIMERLIPEMDKDLGSVAERMMKRKGVDVMTGSKVERIEKDEQLIVDIEGMTDDELVVDKILTSVGRRPTPPPLDLETDITGDKGEIEVDEKMRTEVEGIYAIGDVTARSMLAHSAYKQAEIAVKDMVGEKSKDFSDYHIPAGIYTHPEMASVGLTEREARENYDDISVGKFSISSTGRGSSTGERMGLAKLVADSEDRLIGIHLACPGATDLIMEGTVAIERGMSAQEFADIIHPHPTYSEALKEAAENIFMKSVHSV